MLSLYVYSNLFTQNSPNKQTENKRDFLFLMNIYEVPPVTVQISLRSEPSLYRSSSKELPLLVKITTLEGRTAIDEKFL